MNSFCIWNCKDLKSVPESSFRMQPLLTQVLYMKIHHFSEDLTHDTLTQVVKVKKNIDPCNRPWRPIGL
jgi:hypothetical protein